MKIKCIGCEALARPLYAAAAVSPHRIDITLLQIGLHDTPARLRRRLQEEIDSADAAGYDAILLAYGLCGKATDGVTARTIPLVLPRAHDCITLFLGDRTRYADEFSRNPGTYWYVQDFIERRDSSSAVLSLGAAGLGDISQAYEGFVEKYGRENADYLMEAMSAWQAHYNRAVYIDLGIGGSPNVEAQARQDAERRGWVYERMQGDLRLVRALLEGVWGEDFLVVQPGETIRMSGPDEIVCAGCETGRDAEGKG